MKNFLYTSPSFLTLGIVFLSAAGYQFILNQHTILLLGFAFIWPIFLAYSSLVVHILQKRQKRTQDPLRKAFLLFSFYHVIEFILLCSFLMLLRPGKPYRIVGISKEFGPEIKDVSVQELDRNNNSKTDTLKIMYTTVSDRKLYTFGGTNICYGSNFKQYTCKNISFNLEKDDDHLKEQDLHQTIHKGETQFTTYLFFDSTLPALKDNQYLEFESIGSDYTIMYRRIKVSPYLKTENFEPLPFGSRDSSYPDYINLNSPIE